MYKLTTTLALCAIASINTVDNAQEPTEPTEPALDEVIVGESVPARLEMLYSPANYCKVDSTAEPMIQLIQCKKQRKGWLKI